jgi:hypothetical protein
MSIWRQLPARFAGVFQTSVYGFELVVLEPASRRRSGLDLGHRRPRRAAHVRHDGQAGSENRQPRLAPSDNLIGMDLPVFTVFTGGGLSTGCRKPLNADERAAGARDRLVRRGRAEMAGVEKRDFDSPDETRAPDRRG